MHKSITLSEWERAEIIATLQKRFDELMKAANDAPDEAEKIEYKRTAYLLHGLMSRIKRIIY